MLHWPGPVASAWQRAASLHRRPVMALGLLLGAAIGAAALGIWAGHSGARAFERTIRAQHEKLKISRTLADVWPLVGQVDGPVNNVFTSHDPDGEQARMRDALQRFRVAADAVRNELRPRGENPDVAMALQELSSAAATVEWMATRGEETFDAIRSNDISRAAATMAGVDLAYRNALANLTTVQTNLQLLEDHDLEADLDQLRQLTSYDTATTFAGVILLIASGLYIRRDTRLASERSVLANAQDRHLAIAEYSCDGTLTSANDNFLSMTGYTRDEIRGRHHRAFIDVAEASSPQFDAFWQALQRGEHQSGLYQRRARDGRTLWVRASYYPIRYGEGRPVKIVEFAEDLTAQRMADAERAALASIVAACGDAIVTRTLDGVVTSWNGAAERLFGYADKEVIGESEDRLLSESEARQRELIDCALKQRKDVESYETTRLRKDGTSVPVSVGAFAICDETGSITGVGEVIRDVSARAKAEGLLQQLQAGLDAHAIVATTDPDGRITYVNDKFCELSKYSRDELIGQSHRIVSSQEHSQAYIRNLWTTIQSGETWRGQMHDRAKDGSSYWLDTTIVPVRDNDGDIVKFVAIRTDVTAHRQAMLLLERAAEEAESRNRALAAANAVALAATRAKSDFLASMSHEIRTPMNAVIGMTELLNETALDVQQREYVGRLSRAASNLLELINDILDISKIEANQLAIETKAFDLHALVDGVAELLAPRAFVKRLEFVTVVHPSVPTFIQGDPTRIRQVLVNLAGNAIKFTKRGEVVVRVELVPGTDGGARVRFQVSDTGIGIPSDKLARVFESFTQADTSTTRKYGGTGLGLTISKRLVELMGGRIEVTSAPGCGSTFTFTLDAGQPLPDASPDELATALQHECVLLIMGHETSRIAAAGYLTGAGAHIVDVPDWESARQALEAFEWDGRRPTVVVIEHPVAGMTGIDVATAFVSREACADVPLVMCSSDVDRIPDDVAARLNIVGQLPKPVSRRRLIAAVQRRHTFETPKGEAMRNEPAAGGTRQAVVSVTPIAQDGPPSDDATLRLLIVEDLEENREVLRLYLKNLPYELVMAANGLAGLQQFKSGQFDLVFMDMQMPLMDGYEATASIRAWEREQGRTPTPIVALTASAFPEDIAQTTQAGCSAHVVKPLRKALLLEAIRQHARGASERAA